jgi:DNA-3-methyladenine glycosylase II
MIAEEIKEYLKEKDPKLGNLIDAVTLPALQSDDVYSSLIQSIVSQQLSVKAADTIHKRFLDLFPSKYPYPEFVAALDLEEMRGVGLSYQKANYIKNTANFWEEKGLLNQDWAVLGDDEIIKLLSEIKGVGKWTVQMILMFTLQRQDVLPIDDLGIQQGMYMLYDLDKENIKNLKKQMEATAEAWRPYRSIVSRYIWRYKDTVKSTF